MKESSYVTLFIQKLSKELCDVFLPQGVIPLGGCVVSASENVGMPFAIVVNLEDFSVRSCYILNAVLQRFEVYF